MTTRYLITGGTGWIGRSLIRQLRGKVTVVTRSRASACRVIEGNEIEFIEADIARNVLELSSHEPFDVVVNLAGEPVAGKRWNAHQKLRLRDSRINATNNLCQSLLNARMMPGVLISASAIGIYGDRGDETLDESSRAGNDFLAELAVDWENAAKPLANSGVRVVFPRFGLVLAADGGALAEMLRVIRLGIGGRLGSGRQWMSWIHMQDLLDMLEWLVQMTGIRGPVNAVSPNPVRNAEFTRSLARAVGRPAFVPAPAPLLRLALGEFANSLLASQCVAPSVAVNGGFAFRFPDLDSCLRDIL